MKKIIVSTLVALLGGMTSHSFAGKDFLNVSYDPTREFYQEYNQAFGILETTDRARRRL